MKCPSCCREIAKKDDIEFLKNNGQCYGCYLHEEECRRENERRQPITREMALDAGIPELEGKFWWRSSS